MKKNLYFFMSLLCLLLCGAGNAWAETETIASWVTGTATGCTVTASTQNLTLGGASVKTLKCSNGSSDATATNYAQFTLNTGITLKTGDVIIIEACYNKNEEKIVRCAITESNNTTAYAYDRDNTSNEYVTVDANINSSASGYVTDAGTYYMVVNAAGNGKSSFYVGRAAGGTSTNLFVKSLTITRIAEAPVYTTSVLLDQTALSIDDNAAPVTLTATTDDGYNQGLTWTSSNTEVATVENGVVTPVLGAEGTTTITVTAKSGEETTVQATCEVTVTKHAAITDVVDINGKTIWNWTGANTKTIVPSKDVDTYFAEYPNWKDGFNAPALMGNGQYLYYSSNNCFQGTSLKFRTTVPGIVKITFSDTGGTSSSPRNGRTVKVNGDFVNESVVTTYAAQQQTLSKKVDAGEVVISGYNVEIDAAAYLRIYEVEFNLVPELEKITVNGTDYAAATAVDNIFTINDQTFTKKPVVTYTDSNGEVVSVTMGNYDNATSTGTFTVDETTYTVVANNYYKVENTATATLRGGTSAEGTFSAETWTANVCKNWSNETYTINAADGSGRFGNGYWGSTRKYGFCVSNATLTVEVPAHQCVKGIGIIGAGYYNAGVVSASSEDFIIPTKNTFSKADEPNSAEEVMLIVKNPDYGKSVTFTVSEHNIYIKLYLDEESETLTANVNSTVGYGTFYSVRERQIPANTKAYTGKLNGNTLTLTEIEDGYIPAQTAVVLSGEGGDFVASNTGATTSNPNDLRGTAVALATKDVTGGTVCVLGYENSTAGFYKYTGETLGANKAYLVVPDGAAAPKIQIVFDDEATAINGVQNNESEMKGETYNLAGQKVSSDFNGIVIKNGKKVLVK